MDTSEAFLIDNFNRIFDCNYTTAQELFKKGISGDKGRIHALKALTEIYQDTEYSSDPLEAKIAFFTLKKYLTTEQLIRLVQTQKPTEEEI